jgi:hypothetical protein
MLQAIEKILGVKITEEFREGGRDEVPEGSDRRPGNRRGGRGGGGGGRGGGGGSSRGGRSGR